MHCRTASPSKLVAEMDFSRSPFLFPQESPIDIVLNPANFAPVLIPTNLGRTRRIHLFLARSPSPSPIYSLPKVLSSDSNSSPSVSCALAASPRACSLFTEGHRSSRAAPPHLSLPKVVVATVRFRRQRRSLTAPPLHLGIAGAPPSTSTRGRHLFKLGAGHSYRRSSICNGFELEEGCIQFCS